MNTYIAFGDDDVHDAADDCDEIEHVPRIAEVILSQQIATQNEHDIYCPSEHRRDTVTQNTRPCIVSVPIYTVHGFHDCEIYSLISTPSE